MRKIAIGAVLAAVLLPAWGQQAGDVARGKAAYMKNLC